MQRSDRKAAVAEYKERKVRPGVYAMRRTETGDVWVGSAPNVDAIENRVRFMLGAGNHRSKSLQAAWRACGDTDLAFEILEALEPDLSGYARDTQLKERLERWRAELGAQLL